MATDELEAEQLAPGGQDETDAKKLAGKVPPPMVHEAMGFGGFARANLVAGQGGLDRLIEWVRVMESYETPAHMRPNELLLATGFPAADDPAAPLRVLESLHASGGFARGAQVGRHV